MDAIEEYFQGEYISEKNKINEIDELVSVVLKSLTARVDPNGWPYRLSEGNEYNKAIDYSTSTNSMILFVLAKLNGDITESSSILPYIEWDYNKSLKKTIKESFKDGELDRFIKELDSKCSSNWTESHDYYKEDTTSRIFKKHLVYSNTFGANDPFTLSWIAELINISELQAQKSQLIEISNEIITKAFNTPSKPLLNFNEVEVDPEKGINLRNKRFPSNHIFPLLRTIHLYRSIKSDLPPINKQIVLLDLQNRINQQISHYTIQNSLFDTAELVMSLEGLLLLDENRRIDENLVCKVFDILETNQKNNLNWRPLKPFVTSPQGDVLLPLSIEIANSLLRICKLLERNKLFYFHEYAGIFIKYTQWLLANVSQCTINGTLYKGWRSEHVQEADVIHPWETAQVLTYLMTYKTMIQERIAYKSLKKCGLSCSEEYLSAKGGIGKWDEKWKSTETGTDVYSKIRNSYITRNANSNYSMLLFGPPGTGKTAIGEDLAAALKWRLITITPSDFIKNGEADVEGRAKSIFKTLEQQKDCVILFDEIDRLILDRDSIYYNKQGDMFQFMTPSMLVKIKDLRKAEKCIFIIATNYAERIDSAIKRAGRIDQKYLINLPDKKQRLSIIKERIGKYLNNSIIDNIINSNSDAKLKSIHADLDEIKKSIKSIIDTKQTPENVQKLSELDKQIKELKKSQVDKEKELKEKIADILLKLTVDNSSMEVGEWIVNETVFCAYGEIDAFVKEVCLNLKPETDFVLKLKEIHENQDKPAVRLTNYSRRFQQENEIKLPIYPYKEFFNLLDLQLEVTPIVPLITTEQQIEVVFKNVIKTIYQVVSLDSFDVKEYKDYKCYDLLVFLRKKYKEEKNNTKQSVTENNHE